MEDIQVYHRGDLCELQYGHKIIMHDTDNNEVKVIDLQPNYVNKQVIIIGSYWDLYPSSTFAKDNFKQYSVLFVDGSNQVAWIAENQLKLVGKVDEAEIRRVMKVLYKWEP